MASSEPAKIIPMTVEEIERHVDSGVSGDRVLAARRSIGLTQREFARWATSSQSYVRAIERGFVPRYRNAKYRRVCRVAVMAEAGFFGLAQPPRRKPKRTISELRADSGLKNLAALAREFDIPRETLLRWEAQGILPTEGVDRARWARPSDVEDLIAFEGDPEREDRLERRLRHRQKRRATADQLSSIEIYDDEGCSMEEDDAEILAILARDGVISGVSAPLMAQRTGSHTGPPSNIWWSLLPTRGYADMRRERIRRSSGLD